MKIGVIGVGHMGSTLAKVLSESDAEVLVCDHNQEKVDNIIASSKCVQAKAADICKTCEVVVLGMRPQDVGDFLTEQKDDLRGRRDLLIVTMAAGVKCEQIQSWLGEKVPVMRIMPNTPVEVGAGAIPYCLKDVDDKKLMAPVVSAFEKYAVVTEIDEQQMDAVCALSGSGPAFVYRFIEALAKAGEACGLSAEVSETLATQTVLGASRLAKNSANPPHELADAVCSPGGTTIEGVKVLDSSDFEETVKNCVYASCKRSEELSRV